MAATKRLEKGVVIFVDNFRVMHGRTGFDGNRTVSGAYQTRDDWVSTARAFNLLPSDFYWCISINVHPTKMSQYKYFLDYEK